MKDIKVGVTSNNATATPTSIDSLPAHTQSDYFDNNRWVFQLLPDATKEFNWRELTNVPPQFVMLVGYEPPNFEVPITTLDIFRIDLPSNFYPALYAWPVKGMPVALVCCDGYEREIKELCLKYGAPYVEVYNMVNDGLELMATYPEIDEQLQEQTE